MGNTSLCVWPRCPAPGATATAHPEEQSSAPTIADIVNFMSAGGQSLADDEVNSLKAVLEALSQNAPDHLCLLLDELKEKPRLQLARQLHAEYTFLTSRHRPLSCSGESPTVRNCPY